MKRLQAYLNLTMNKNIGIYVHFPFCKRKCAYCDFVSFPNLELESEYVSLLIDEISSSDVKGKISTVYFGGGTPSVLDAENIEKVLSALKNLSNAEFCPTELTIEANPESLTYEKALFYKKIGFNRISIGVQSFDDSVLKICERLHNAETALNAVKIATDIFDNVSCDLIVGLPGQSVDVLTESIEILNKFNVKHVSCYTLQLEEGTRLYNRVQSGKLTLPSEDEVCDAFNAVKQKLNALGFNRYEVSNFSKLGYESRHNLSYWQRINYIGYGISAHSLIDNVRFNNPSTFAEYKEMVLNGKGRFETVLSVDDVRFEKLMLGLRMTKGVDVDCFAGYESILNRYKDFFDFNGDKVSFNDRGFEVMNSILIDFM